VKPITNKEEQRRMNAALKRHGAFVPGRTEMTKRRKALMRHRFRMQSFYHNT